MVVEVEDRLSIVSLINKTKLVYLNMSENPQYDNFLGGNQELPASVRLVRFTAARWKEIKAMKQSLSSTKGGKLVFQKLPIHMRRRVMSHNAKRLPRRLKEVHMNQLKKSGLGSKQSRPSRKYRRRPENLCAEYTKRQRKLKWLETHIWHAKRFHMVERWGYKLPLSPCDKSFRACYRASAQHCLLEDISYMGCLEINAREDFIIDNFNKIYDKNINLGIGAKAYINGNREGKLTLFSNGKALGVVNFHWMPKNKSNLHRTLWIWIHAALFDSVLNTLIKLFNLQLENNAEYKNIYENKENNVLLCDLRFELNRFRLTGPLSNAVLQNCLKPVDLRSNTLDWLNNYITEDIKTMLTKQTEYWKHLENLSSSAELSSHIIIGLIAVDPRYNMPKKRTKALNNNSKTPSWNFIETLPEMLSMSPIWNSEVRKIVKGNKISNSKFCEMRQKLLVPGTDLNIPGIPVPYLLIQRPGNKYKNIGYCSGWDLILPSGWGQPTWLTMIMWGARAGGLREADSNLFEMGLPSNLEPDTEAGKREDERYSELYKHRYFSLPPNKRINYTKFSIASPFEYKWKVLLKDWNCFPTGTDHFYALRDKKLLQMFQDNLTKKHGAINNELIANLQMPYIVPVKLTIDQKGIPKQYSIICLPVENDFKSPQCVTEYMKNDENQIERIRLRAAHKLLLKKLKRYRKYCKLTGKKYVVQKDYIGEYKQKMENLWLPDINDQIRTSCSREIIGWVTKGDFSFTIGASAAVGYVVIGSLPSLFALQPRNKVLVRNTNCRQYRMATVEVIL